MKQRVEKAIELTLGRREIERVVGESLIKAENQRDEPKLISIEISEVSIPPSGIQIKFRALTSVIAEVPDKIFAPPSKS
jgi:hypothetical protein